MGGGGQANSKQASQAAAQQTAASQQDMALSAQNAATQKQMLSKLFGTGSGDNQGALGGMLDPAKLNDANLSGAYKSAYNQGTNQLAKDYSNQKGSLAQAWANRGMGSGSTPSGFQADQERQLGSSEADSRGQAFTSALGAQHQETLNNFWNAGNIASGNAATAGSNALQGAGQSGSSSAQIYGTAGQYHPSPYGSVLGSALGAGGQVGAAAMGKPPKGCWIAEAIYGTYDPRTLLLRHWLNTEFTKGRLGRFVMLIYLTVGEQVASAVRRNRFLRALFTPIFDRALSRARAWERQHAN